MKRLLHILTAYLLFLSLTVPLNVMAADNSVWIQQRGKEEWRYKDGMETDLTAKIQGETLYIQGKGAIPNYDRDHLGNRPWHNKQIRSLVISDNVTSIGTEAFSNMNELYHVTMSAGTFIESPTAFSGIVNDCTFEFMGTNIRSRDIGNVPYNSLDSIAAFMQHYNGTFYYRLANYYMVGWVQNSVLPKIDKLSPSDVHTTYRNAEYPIQDFKSSLEFISAKPDSSMHAHITSKQQGIKALEIFSMVLGDATYATAYNMSVSSFDGMITQTDEPLTYQMTIPESLQYPGRQFSLIQLGDGVVNTLTDEDQNDTTMTFTTDYPSTVYALIYRDFSPSSENIATEFLQQFYMKLSREDFSSRLTT